MQSAGLGVTHLHIAPHLDVNIVNVVLCCVGDASKRPWPVGQRKRQERLRCSFALFCFLQNFCVSCFPLLPRKLKARRTGPLFCRKARPFSLISGIEDANSQVSNLPGDFCGGLHFARSERGS
jgi:hypothetical protein